jgi:hypothetical protein
VNKAKSLRDERVAMDRQQILALFLTVLMIGSSIAYGAVLFF